MNEVLALSVMWPFLKSHVGLGWMVGRVISGLIRRMISTWRVTGAAGIAVDTSVTVTSYKPTAVGVDDPGGAPFQSMLKLLPQNGPSANVNDRPVACDLTVKRSLVGFVIVPRIQARSPSVGSNRVGPLADGSVIVIVVCTAATLTEKTAHDGVPLVVKVPDAGWPAKNVPVVHPIGGPAARSPWVRLPPSGTSSSHSSKVTLKSPRTFWLVHTGWLAMTFSALAFGALSQAIWVPLSSLMTARPNSSGRGHETAPQRSRQSGPPCSSNDVTLTVEE